jgi:hypothetical protein
LTESEPGMPYLSYIKGDRETGLSQWPTNMYINIQSRETGVSVNHERDSGPLASQYCNPLPFIWTINPYSNKVVKQVSQWPMNEIAVH